MINILELILLLFGILIGQIIILFIGITFLFFLPMNDEFPPLQKLAMSYGLGAGALCLSMFLCILLDINSRISFLPIVVIVIPVFLYFKIYKSIFQDVKDIFSLFKNKRFSRGEIVCIVILVFEIILLLSHWFLYPNVRWDSIAIWDAKAKVIFYEGNLNSFSTWYEHPNYPLFIPLILNFFYSLFFQYHYFAQIFAVSFFISLMIFFYYSLRRIKLNRTYSLIITTLLALLGRVFDYSHFIMADLPLTYYYSISVIFLFYYISTEKKQFLIYSAIFSGFMAWVKQEGIYLLILNFIILLLYQLILIVRKKFGRKQQNQMTLSNRTFFRNFIVSFGVAILLYIPWQLFSSFHNQESEYLGSIGNFFNVSETLSELIIIFRSAIIILLNPISWGAIFWIMFIIIVILNFKSLFKDKIMFITITCLLHFLLKILFYTITPYGLVGQLFSSLNREIVHMTPICCFLIGLILVNNNTLVLDFDKDSFSRKLVYFFIVIFIVSLILLFLFYDELKSLLQILGF